MLNSVAYLDPPLFKSLYTIQKQQLLSRAFNAWNNNKVEIQRNLINYINNFSPVNCNKGKQTGFIKVKNHLSTGVFMIEEKRGTTKSASNESRKRYKY